MTDTWNEQPEAPQADRILLLLDRRKNKELLRDWLSHRYEVLEAPPDTLVDKFDLAVVDGTSLDRHFEELQQRKVHDLPLFLPILFITNRSDIGMVTRHLWRSIDDIILIPIEKIELVARVEVLLRARHLSVNLEAANRIKINFLAMISHELRTPLTSVKGFASTILARDIDWSPDEYREFVGVIDEEAGNMQDLVEQLLDLARLQAGTFSIEPKLGLFRDILKDAENQIAALSAQHHFAVTLPETRYPVLIDAHRIGQVLVNLVGNAAKFSPAGSEIRLDVARHGRYLQADLLDEGPGISPADREVIFEAFRQVGKLSNGKGAGLGLAICKGVIEAHGGTIWVADHPGPGTQISFTLPIVESAPSK